MAMDIKPGDIIKTNYGSGPHIVEKVFGPCRCSEIVVGPYQENKDTNYLNPDGIYEKEHYHFICRCPKGHTSRRYFLNGYFQTGDRYRNIWFNRSEIFVVGQGDLSQIPSYKNDHGQLRLF